MPFPFRHKKPHFLQRKQAKSASGATHSEDEGSPRHGSQCERSTDMVAIGFERSSAEQYYHAELGPTLNKGLAALCRARPANPVQWLGEWLAANKPSNDVLGVDEADAKRLRDVFKQFDSDGDGALTMGEMKRAFRAVGFEKRMGFKAEMDYDTFRAMDTDNSGTIDLEEWEQNLRPDLRAMIQEKVRTGWKFNPALWAESQSRHSHWNVAKVFSKFDTSGDGYLTMMELMRAFRAIGLPNREGTKLEVDQKMFRMLDTNESGMVSLDEFEENLPDDVRAKIVEKLEAGWVFEPEKWSGRRDK